MIFMCRIAGDVEKTERMQKIPGTGAKQERKDEYIKIKTNL